MGQEAAPFLLLERRLTVQQLDEANEKNSVKPPPNSRSTEPYSSPLPPLYIPSICGPGLSAPFGLST
ncbi:hypothetical protein FF1_034394 [Malus domestica]